MNVPQMKAGKRERGVREAAERGWVARDGYMPAPRALLRPSDAHDSEGKLPTIPDDRMHFPFGSDGEERQ